MVAPEYKLLPAITHKGTDAVCELHGLLQTISGTVQDIQVYMVGMLSGLKCPGIDLWS